MKEYTAIRTLTVYNHQNWQSDNYNVNGGNRSLIKPGNLMTPLKKLNATQALLIILRPCKKR